MSSSSRLRFLFRSGEASSDGRATPFVASSSASSETSPESDSLTSESCSETDDKSSEFATESESSSIGSDVDFFDLEEDFPFAAPFAFCFFAGPDYTID